ncbi:MAG: hypothetical protein P8X43_13940, partial [Maritimibacter sp.]
IAKMKIPPFIATLGMMLILKGLSLVVSGTRPIYFNDTPGFDQISRGSLIGDVIPALPIPNGVMILFIVAMAASYILGRTVLGRYCFALGSNEEAVRLSGVNTDRWKQHGSLEDGDLCPRWRHLRHRRHPDRLAPELGPAGPGPGLRA